MQEKRELTLEPPELAFADDLGRRLAEFRERQGSRHKNNLVTTLEQRIAMNIVGARGEAALYKFLGGKAAGVQWDVSVGNDRSWGKTPEIIHRNQPYDAKGVPKNNLALMVYPDFEQVDNGVKKTWRYVLVGTELAPKFLMLGWCTGADVLTTKLQQRKKGRPAYFIDQGDPLLRECTLLIETPAPTPTELKCDYCQRSDGQMHAVAIGNPKSNDVINVTLHQGCERGYLRMIDD